jgi:CheY-like chemotaxis protein
VKKVLVAEDDPALRELVRETLSLLGYEVVEAADGEEALRKIQESVPDLALLDMQMPKLDGAAVIQRIRSDPRLAKLPVVALTGMAMRGDRESGLESGFDDYLTKPVSAKELKKLLAEMLGN